MKVGENAAANTESVKAKGYITEAAEAIAVAGGFFVVVLTI